MANDKWKMIRSPRVRVFLGLMLGLALLVAVVAVVQRRLGYYGPPFSLLPSASPTPEVTPILTPSPTANSPSPLPTEMANVPSPFASPSASPTPEPTIPPSVEATLKLIVPVAGVKREQLLDTFGDSRSEGRVHDAIDIPAALGTPVLAATDGEIVKLFQSERGGTTIYQLSSDKQLIFYYAHLQQYANGLYEGKYVRQGETIAYVGDTGNAGPGNYHLHFSIMIVSDPKRYWEGTSINPYPLLRQQ